MPRYVKSCLSLAAIFAIIAIKGETEEVLDKVSDEVVHLPEDLAAVCLDANAMSRGRLNIGAIEDLVEIIESQELEVRVLVPEPVVWEWAEHLASELADARSSYDSAHQQATDAGAAALIRATLGRADLSRPRGERGPRLPQRP